MSARSRGRRLGMLAVIAATMLLALSRFSFSAPPVDTSLPGAAAPPIPAVDPSLIGKRVDAVRITGNDRVSSQVILNLIRTHEGDKFDPATVEEDYKRVYDLRRFADVKARVEPTRAGGVEVVFAVTEQQLIRSIAFRGARAVDSKSVKTAADLQVGDAIDRFRISLAQRTITQLYKTKNYPFAHVDVDLAACEATGDIVFNVVSGPRVTIRMVNFDGNKSFTGDKLKDQIKTAYEIWIFRPGTYDPDTVDQDVAALRRFYQNNGYFDVKVDRKLTFSPDQTDLKVTFLIDEGPRYRVDRVSFTGNTSITEARLRQDLKLVEGRYFDFDLLQGDVKQIVKAYSPGYIYDPQSNDPGFLRIGKPNYPYPAKIIWGEPGHLELVYEIAEGTKFRLGTVQVVGNTRTQRKVVDRELHLSPGDLYNSGEIADGVDRIKNTRLFSNVQTTPIGDAPDTRDLLVKVDENRTASFQVGAGVNSNGGFGGNFTFEQSNFDIAAPPESFRDFFTDRTFTGAGQDLRISIEPGSEQTNASIRFSEPYLFDQPYGFTGEVYALTHDREHWLEQRIGASVTFDKRFDYVWSAGITLRGEDVKIYNIENQFGQIKHVTNFLDPTQRIRLHLPSTRGQDILDDAGHSTITSATLRITRDTTSKSFFPWKGTNLTFNWSPYGALGGEFFFNKFTIGYDAYQMIAQDLLDRRTILGLHLDAGYITPDAPFYERFYGGGIGNVRGFSFRGISPRMGTDNDPVGGNFSLNGTLELGFPIYGDNFRGVIFTDAGTVEQDAKIRTIRSSVGAGVRVVIPFFGQAPLALDFAVPITKAPQDEVQYVSFSFGFVR